MSSQVCGYLRVRFAAANEKVNRPEYLPLATAGSPLGPESSGVMNFDPIAGIAFRTEMSPAGKSTVVFGKSSRRMPTRRNAGVVLETAHLPIGVSNRAQRKPEK